MSDTDRPRIVEGQIMSRPHNDVEMPPNMPAGIPALARAKYWAARKTLESYTRAIRSQEEAFDALGARDRARIRYAQTLERLNKLDTIREAARLEVDEELAFLQERKTARLQAAELRQIEHRGLKAELTGRAIAAERRLQELEEKKDPPKNQTPGERAKEEIFAIRETAKELKAAIVEVYGGEGGMSEDDRVLLDDLEQGTRNRIASIIEQLK